MSLDLPGFADPVIGAQTAFRAVLDAMARPGTVHEAGHGLTPPAPLAPAAAAAVLTLVDADTALHLDAAFAGARDWIAFHCGASFAGAIGGASFVLAPAIPDLTTLDCGSDDGPETSATAIVQIEAIGEGPAFTLAGPGLKAPARFSARGLPVDFVARWARNHALFPRGVDLILCAGTRLAALPRSVSIREG